MTDLPFTQYQVFHSKAKTLREQISAYYNETQNSSVTIQLLLAMKIRNQLGEQDFELFLKDLVRHLFSKATVNRALRRYFYFFSEYFEETEWEMMTARCFPPEHSHTDLMEVVEANVPVTGTDFDLSESS
ncbi:hypothetical protein JZO70_12620 [Enterococcus sp. 669A]|uniref:Uncharacterized protein n=1 Tax=Candidatus Enterococcus moelleringii TaxID=2815325 RepID=A0ABS3LBJ6_9ENTE|nr:hypothetical protein [Enterococcus sp. 669A]MBO1307012.1 hypothetical protein [Enterococcus sp. 669A]